MQTYGHFIGGKRVAGTSGRTADVFWPMTGEIAAKVALAGPDEVRAAVENARDAQVGWAAVNPQRRARVFMKFLDLDPSRTMDETRRASRPRARQDGRRTPRATSSAATRWSSS